MSTDAGSEPIQLPEVPLSAIADDLPAIKADAKPFVCPQCGKLTPAWRGKAQTGYLPHKRVCADCAPIVVARLQELPRREAVIQVIRKIVGSDQVSPVHVGRLLEAVIGRFGGMEEFAGFWYRQIKHAARAKPGGRDVLNACGAIGKLAASYSVSLPSVRRTDQMSEQDLER